MPADVVEGAALGDWFAIATAFSAEAIAVATRRCRSSVLSPEGRKGPPPPSP